MREGDGARISSKAQQKPLHNSLYNPLHNYTRSTHLCQSPLRTVHTDSGPSPLHKYQRHRCTAPLYTIVHCAPTTGNSRPTSRRHTVNPALARHAAAERAPRSPPSDPQLSVHCAFLQGKSMSSMALCVGDISPAAWSGSGRGPSCGRSTHSRPAARSPRC